MPIPTEEPTVITALPWPCCVWCGGPLPFESPVETCSVSCAHALEQDELVGEGERMVTARLPFSA